MHVYVETDIFFDLCNLPEEASRTGTVFSVVYSTTSRLTGETFLFCMCFMLLVFLSSHFWSKRDTLHLWDELDSVEFKCLFLVSGEDVCFKGDECVCVCNAGFRFCT